MKGKASKFKHIISMVSALTRDKCMAIRSKTDAMKARLMVTAFTLLSKRNNLSLGSISAKINDAIDGIFTHHTTGDDATKAIVLYESKSSAASTAANEAAETSNYSTVEEFDQDDDDDKYPDLRHSLFDEEEEEELAQLLEDPSSSISAIDIVKNAKEDGEKFNLEDEINEVADLFITKFHKRMRLQKLLSFKRHQEILDGASSDH